MIVYTVGFTEKGKRTGEKLFEALSSGQSTSPEPSWKDCQTPITFYFHWREENQSLHDFVAEAFRYHLPLLFIGAAGISVRAISPFVEDKMTDSPVLVMDDRGRNIIPILSGHLGGANDLAGIFAEAIGAVPVITTASDVNGCFAADVFARRNGLAVRNREGIRLVADKALDGEAIRIAVDPDIQLITEEVPAGLEITENLNEPVDILVTSDPWKPFQAPQKDIDSGRDDLFQQETVQAIPAGVKLWLSPKTIVIGMGCRRGKSLEELNTFLLKAIKQNLTELSDVADHKVEEFIRLHVRAIATIDRKADEEGLQILAQYWHLPLLTYTVEELNDVSGDFAESEFVKETTGVANVCERAATCAAGDHARLIIPKQAENGMTLAAAEGKAIIHTFDTAVIKFPWLKAKPAACSSRKM